MRAVTKQRPAGVLMRSSISPELAGMSDMEGTAVELAAEVLAIERDLLAGAIDGITAARLLTAPRQKPWQRPEWADARRRRLGPCCVVCGSSERLVLQHLWQPEPFFDIVIRLGQPLGFTDQVLYERVEQRLAAEGMEEPPEPGQVERPACPRCGGTNVRELATEWVCQTKRNRRPCGHHFETPAVGQGQDLDALRAAPASSGTAGRGVATVPGRAAGCCGDGGRPGVTAAEPALSLAR